MDPNETLSRIRTVRLLMAVYGSDTVDPQLTSLAFELFELVGSLDDWMSTDGQLPDAWRWRPQVRRLTHEI